MQTSQLSSTQLRASLAGALISNVASLMSSPARLSISPHHGSHTRHDAFVEWTLTILCVKITASVCIWLPLVCYWEGARGGVLCSCLTIFSSHILKLFSRHPIPMLLYMCDLFSNPLLPCWVLRAPAITNSNCVLVQDELISQLPDEKHLWNY